MEKRYLHKDGEVVWVHLSVALVRSVDGAPAYSVAHVLELKERRHAAAAPAAASGATASLTAREREVLGLLAAGATSGEVAAALGIGEETVQTHVRRARVKLAARTRTEAVATALRLGLLESPEAGSAPGARAAA
jgi:DNA-binding CsgD family transcriptional regulator